MAPDEIGETEMAKISPNEIALVMTSGSADDDDQFNAKTAAAEYLTNAGVTVADAAAEYLLQWAKFDDEAPMTGLARIWIDAGRAASDALTQGWADPDGASCALDATP